MTDTERLDWLELHAPVQLDCELDWCLRLHNLVVYGRTAREVIDQAVVSTVPKESLIS